MIFRQSIRSGIEIEATGDRVWQNLSDLEQYRHWNRSTRFNTAPKAGKVQLMLVKLGVLWLPVPVLIQHCNARQGLRWIGGIPGLITGSHYFQPQAIDQNRSRLAHGEDFSGLLVPVLLPLLSKVLDALYDTINSDIKAQCERGQL